MDMAEDKRILNEQIRPLVPPTNVEVIEVKGKGVTLKWDWPFEDHPEDEHPNAFMIFFKQVREDRWTEFPDQIKATDKKHSIRGQVSGLENGAKYEFRVQAMNRLYGSKSDLSDATVPIHVKENKAAPKIDHGPINKSCVNDHQRQRIMRVKSNQQVSLDIPVQGVPLPFVTWYKDGEEVVHSERIRVPKSNVRMSVARLVIIRVSREDRGHYVLNVKNEHGSDQSDFYLEVYGRPAPPEGPIQIHDLSAKNCRVSWKVTPDDGGDSRVIYEVEKAQYQKDIGDIQWLPVGRTLDTEIEVKNLSPGKEYCFRIRASNKFGDSAEITIDAPILAKNPYDPPSAPGEPEICDWGPDFADIRWNTPEDDGGSEISSYRIEVRDRSRRGWLIAGTADESDAVVTDNIEPGNEYEFRVVAINKAGESDYSNISKPIKAESRFLKPEIRILAKQKKVRTKQTLTIEAEVKGVPAPKVSWWSPKRIQLEESERCRILSGFNEKYTLEIKDVCFKDAGNYKIKAKNSAGFGEAECTITVVGPPTPPQGPLEITEISEHGCSLSWFRPDYDGGSSIKSYVIEKRTKESSWIPCTKISGSEASIMKQLDAHVTNLLRGQDYLFRVIACNSYGESDPLELSDFLSLGPPEEVPHKPNAPRIKEVEKNWVILTWDFPDDVDNIDKFIIEKQEQFQVPKSPDENSNHGELKNPLLSRPSGLMRGISYTGELEDFVSNWTMAVTVKASKKMIKIEDLIEKHKYRFRMKCVNKYGSSEPSEPSRDILCRQKQRPIIDRKSLQPVWVSSGDKAVITIKFTGDPIPKRSWFINKTKVLTSNNLIIEERDHSSKLIILSTQESKQLEFIVENEFGQETALIDVFVMTPPSKPRGPLKIDSVSADACFCTWNHPDHDGGSSILKYIVERQRQGKAEWKVCGRSKTTNFQVTGLTYGAVYKLRVSAENAEGLSEPLEQLDSFKAENPFGVPGTAGPPVYVDGDHEGVIVAWDSPKHDGGSPLIGFEIEARPWRGSNYFQAAEIKEKVNKTEITTLEFGKSYALRVRAKNKAGPGPWSLDSDQIVIKHRTLVPKIAFMYHSDKIIINEGEKLEVDVEVEAEPRIDKVIFEVDGKPIEMLAENENTQISKLTDNCFRLTIPQCTKKRVNHTQMLLTCSARNRHGSGIGTLPLIVQAKPSPPAVLEARINHKTGSCKLVWQSSMDQGGLAPVTYIVEKQLLSNNSSVGQWQKVGSTSETCLELKDLNSHDQEYNFRVKACNSVGESEPEVTRKPVKIKNPYSVPLPPGCPEVTFCSEQKIDLTWTEPIDDGGLPVQGYRIESRLNESGPWQLFESLNANITNVSLQMLNKGTIYQFRVIAVTKAGKSDPSHPSRPTKACNTNVPPTINCHNLKDVTKVEAGARVKLKATIDGEPEPEVEWKKEESNGCISNSIKEEIKVSFLDREAQLVFNNIKKSQEGIYNLTAKNASGSSDCSFKIVVLDRPSLVQTLTVEIKSDDCCLLRWRSPQDDGGAPVDYYQIERLEKSRGSWMAIGRSKGLSHEVLGLKAGMIYTFRVSAVNRYGESDPVETDEVTTTK